VVKNILLVVVLFLGGCSYKHDSLYVGSKKTTEQGVANTKKIELPKKGKPKIFVTVTYLNSIENRKFVDKNLEQFVVGIHQVGMDLQNRHKKIPLNSIEFNIDNSSIFVSAKELKPDDRILNIVPASNPWSQYFLVQTPKIEKNFIDFSVEIYPYSLAVLKFEKDY